MCHSKGKNHTRNELLASRRPQPSQESPAPPPLRAPIGDMLPGRNPAAVADALVTLLPAHAIVHNAHDPATMAAALALAVDQDDADGEPGKRGNQRDTLAQ